jgi:hypothetical protein
MSIFTITATALGGAAFFAVATLGVCEAATPGTLDNVQTAFTSTVLESAGIDPAAPTVAELPKAEVHEFNFDGVSTEKAAQMYKDIADLQSAGAGVTFK